MDRGPERRKDAFELVILTFGSGFDVENEEPEYLVKIRGLVEYAGSKGIALGGYSLLASRKVSEADDVVNPKTGRPGGFATFGDSPCLGSRWGQDYFRKLRQFFERTGAGVLEHDGSHPGDACASTAHPGHRGYEDSQWAQWTTIRDLYRWCRARGVYLNVPDWYSEAAIVRGEDGVPRRVALARDHGITTRVKVPARGRTWLTMEEP